MYKDKLYSLEMLTTISLTKKLIGVGLAGLTIAGISISSTMPDGQQSSQAPSAPDSHQTQSAAPLPAGTAPPAAFNQPQATSGSTEATKGTLGTSTKLVEVTERIAYESEIQIDQKLPTGQSRVESAGADGERIVTYRVTYTDGKEVRREAVKADITKQPVPHVTVVGSKHHDRQPSKAVKPADDSTPTSPIPTGMGL